MNQKTRLINKYAGKIKDKTEIAKGHIDALPDEQYTEALNELLNNLIDAIAETLAELEMELKEN